MPQAASAHDTFWDFISLMPESAHMIMWLMSDRAIPRSYRMMEGFGVHTFRLINEQGDSNLVKFTGSRYWVCTRLPGMKPRIFPGKILIITAVICGMR